MSEACTLSLAENKRKLPAWMLKTCSSNQAAKIDDRNKLPLEFDERIGYLDQSKPIKRQTVSRLRNVNSEGAGELGVLQRCEGREKARRKSKDAIKDEVEEIEKVMNKNAKKASGRAASKNSRKRKLENAKLETSSLVTIDDEIELTVEDLLSIAEEYVHADKQKQHELEAVKTAGRKEHILCPTISTESDTGGSVVNARSVKGLMQCTTDTRPSEHRGDENKSHQELQCTSRFETTGDVAQDMLNLFLGPLWSKPAGYARKAEPVESMTTTINHVPEKKDWHSEVRRQGEPVKKSQPIESMATTMDHVPEKKDWRSEVPWHGELVTKKKSSLKDKVALFL